MFGDKYEIQTISSLLKSMKAVSDIFPLRLRSNFLIMSCSYSKVKLSFSSTAKFLRSF
jgi:hypothetical protein